jgi:hypothetical protein
MKRLLLASLLALPLLAATQQKASAGCHFSCGGCCHFSFSCGGCCNFSCGCNPCCSGCDGGYGYGFPGYYGGYPGCWDSYGGYGIVGGNALQAPAVAPSAAGAPSAQYPAAISPNSGFQPVGYYQAPSYWYGN